MKGGKIMSQYSKRKVSDLFHDDCGCGHDDNHGHKHDKDELERIIRLLKKILDEIDDKKKHDKHDDKHDHKHDRKHDNHNKECDAVVLTFTRNDHEIVLATTSNSVFGCPLNEGDSAAAAIACLYNRGFKIEAFTQQGEFITYTLVRCR